MTDGGCAEAEASRLFDEQLAQDQDLLEQFIKSDQCTRESLDKLRVVADENRALKARVSSVAEALATAETEVLLRAESSPTPFLRAVHIWL